MSEAPIKACVNRVLRPLLAPSRWPLPNENKALSPWRQLLPPQMRSETACTSPPLSGRASRQSGSERSSASRSETLVGLTEAGQTRRIVATRRAPKGRASAPTTQASASTTQAGDPTGRVNAPTGRSSAPPGRASAPTNQPSALSEVSRLRERSSPLSPSPRRSLRSRRKS